jgi:hypothetical protein
MKHKITEVIQKHLKYSLRHRSALDVEKQLWLGAEGANELDLDGVNVHTELDNKSLNSSHIRRLTFMPSRIHCHLKATDHKFLLVSKNKKIKFTL